MRAEQRQAVRLAHSGCPRQPSRPRALRGRGHPGSESQFTSPGTCIGGHGWGSPGPAGIVHLLGQAGIRRCPESADSGILEHPTAEALARSASPSSGAFPHRPHLGGEPRKVSTVKPRSGAPDHSRRRTGGIGQTPGAPTATAALLCGLWSPRGDPRREFGADVSPDLGPLLQRCAEGRGPAPRW